MNPREPLIAAKDYREFLRLYFAALKEENPRFSYAVFARKAWLRAKSFPHAVAHGRKRLTLASTRAFVTGLGLREDWRTYFALLVSLEEEEVRPPHLNREQVLARLEKLRSKLRAELKKTSSGKPFPKYPEFRYWSEIFAALGTRKTGAALEDIVRRTSLPEDECHVALAKMMKAGIVTASGDSGRYFPCEPHLILDALGSDEFFKTQFLGGLSEAREKAKTNFSAETHLFLSSVFSVDTKLLPEFTLELKDLVTKFVDRAETADGNRVAKLSLALFPI